MKTYLVTGAAGFIGSRLAARLIREGHRVVTIDNLSTGRLDRLPTEVVFLRGDCFDQELIDQLQQHRFEAIFHLAGQSSGEISFDDPVYDLQTNTQSTLQLLNYARETGCRKFIYASSMSVYGDMERLPAAEEDRVSPKSFYAVGKLASEHYLRIYSGVDMATTALRLFNVYGPGQDLANLRQGMASIFLSQALQQGHILVKGSPDRFRDFVYIDDVVEAFMATEQNLSGTRNLLCNICSGRSITVRALVESIRQHLPEPVTVEYTGSTPGDQFGIYGDPTRARELFGWTSATAFPQGMKQMIEWATQQ